MKKKILHLNTMAKWCSQTLRSKTYEQIKNENLKMPNYFAPITRRKRSPHQTWHRGGSYNSRTSKTCLHRAYSLPLGGTENMGNIQF